MTTAWRVVVLKAGELGALVLGAAARVANDQVAHSGAVRSAMNREDHGEHRGISVRRQARKNVNKEKVL